MSTDSRKGALLRSFLVLVALMSIMAVARGETVRGTIVSTDQKSKVFTVDCQGAKRTFRVVSSTQFLDADGKAESALGRFDLPFWKPGGEGITVVTKGGNIASTVQLPVKIQVQRGAGPAPGDSFIGQPKSDAMRGPVNMIGTKLPEFDMKGIDGSTISSRELGKSVLVLDFWATWCGPCKRLSPTMQALHEKYGKAGVVVIGASTFEQGDARKLVTQYATEHKYTYRMTYDNAAFASKVGVSPIPCVMIVGKDGIVKKVFVGLTPSLAADIEAAVKKLIKK